MKTIVSLFCFLSILQYSNALNLNDIKKMKTNPTTIATTTTTTGAPEYITFTMTTPGAMLTDCPAGCASGRHYGSKCYKKFDTPATHSQAVTNCQLEGGELVQIEDSSESDVLRKAFDTNALVDETKETWIGLASTSGSWKCTDGSAASFTNWAQTQSSFKRLLGKIFKQFSNHLSKNVSNVRSKISLINVEKLSLVACEK
ncbi:hypothetical protein B9Z55_016662 [Caenorhabditis nigoni]|uniref:C-type lectin domain-containing protein n=1 Tax=Caenorhabditis nigoni TaxID=1611254 RepID=A0A2G5T615_9PELO|nr:hypothetical protein B9Z55_016662 [Caenorhabditis nigoni]